MPEEYLKTKLRKTVGSSSSRQLRNDNSIPAIIYGNNFENKTLELDKSDFTKFLASNNVGSTVDVKVGRKKVFAIVKAIQKHPLTNAVLHVDFQALTKGEKVKLKVPVVINGRNDLAQDWILHTSMDTIEIQTIPKYLIDKVEIDVSNAKLGDSFTVGDLAKTIDENIEILVDEELTIYSITEAERFVEPDDTEADEELLTTNQPTEENDTPAEPE